MAFYDETGAQMAGIDFKGRLRAVANGSTAEPSVATGAQIGTGGAVSISGTDMSGTITITTGTDPAAGTPASLTFGSAFAAAPRVVILMPKDAHGTALGYYAASSAAAFSVGCASGPVAATSYRVDYMVISS